MASRPAERLLPPLLPASRWGRVALVLLVLFALARSVMWASAQPGWFAPDEDYHWNYVEHILVEKTLPDLDKPFATGELYDAAYTIKQGQYVKGARTDYSGDPHAALPLMQKRHGLRRATGEPPRQVLHPPLYHLGATLVDRATTTKSAVTRLTAMRYYSAVLGAIAVWLAWLLASQVLSRTWEQLSAAALVATQPIAAFSASTMTNDAMALPALTAVLAWCAWALRRPPRARDGLVLGALLAIAVLTKSTLLAAFPLAALALVMAWRAFRLRPALVARVAGAALLVFAVATAWWWRIVLPETHSLLGARVAIASGPAKVTGGSAVIPSLPDAVYNWLDAVYRGYWFDYLGYEVPAQGFWYYLPLVVGCIGLAALAWLVVSLRRTLFDPERPVLRQVVLLVAAALALLLPPLWFDVRNAMAGHAFSVQQGRFVVPAYAAVAVLFVLAVSYALRGSRRLAPAVLGAVVALSFVSYCHTWVRWCLERFYGPVHGDWTAAFRRASFDKPEWVGAGWFTGLAIVGIVAFAAAFAIAVRGSVRERRGPDPAPEPQGPPRREREPAHVASA
jgi:4-amino-4-deoxy-L-arabinose transferase-like glycosyltransferase